MTANEITEIAIDSTTNYCNYLDETKKCFIEIDVLEVKFIRSKDCLIKLRLSSKLFDTEFIFFKLNLLNKQYNTTEVKIIEYDFDKNILLVRIIPAKETDFINLKATDIKVISDIKFLTKRVGKWYENNGSDISIPTKFPSLKNNYLTIEYLEGKIPSETQKLSIKNIFTNPFSYIWGAPGTGKTQFVLAYAVLHYLKNNKRVAILAPTNNAIEQVLRGVIKMTDEAGIDRSKIIRYGSPSRKFAEEFPEVCEEKSIQKQLKGIDVQINILERIISYESSLNELKKAGKALIVFDEINIQQNKVVKNKKITDKNKRTLDKKKEYLDIKVDEIIILSNQKKSIEKSIDSFWNKILRFFNSDNYKLKLRLFSIDNLINKKIQENEILQDEYKEIQFDYNLINKLYTSELLILDDTIEKTKLNFQSILKLDSIVKLLDVNNIDKIKSQLIEKIEEEAYVLEINKEFSESYNNFTLTQLKNELKNYKNSRSKLTISSTEESLNSVNVIAYTLDGYISRYVESKLEVDHIFLDEVGYASIIKALTLFNNNTPITFLGDHQQLPPVCEIRDKEIKNTEKYKSMVLWAQSAIYIETLFNNTYEEVCCQYNEHISLANKVLSQTFLNTTFRFGTNMAKILGKHLYKSELNSMNQINDIKILYINAIKMNDFKSRISSTEVEAIKKYIYYLKSNNNLDYVILTPYTKQLELLKQEILQESLEFKILTVHASQGREWDTVILSIVDTSDMWSVDSKHSLSKGLNLINTAVSRAKNN